MNAADVVSLAMRSKVLLVVKEGKIIAKGDASAVSHLLLLLRQYKEEVLTLLAQTAGGVDYAELYHERAGIQEEGDLPRIEAERLAYQSVLEVYMRNHHPEILSHFDRLIRAPIIH